MPGQKARGLLGGYDDLASLVSFQRLAGLGADDADLEEFLHYAPRATRRDGIIEASPYGHAEFRHAVSLEYACAETLFEGASPFIRYGDGPAQPQRIVAVVVALRLLQDELRHHAHGIGDGRAAGADIAEPRRRGKSPHDVSGRAGKQAGIELQQRRRTVEQRDGDVDEVWI